jgi:hypothetical protein
MREATAYQRFAAQSKPYGIYPKVSVTRSAKHLYSIREKMYCRDSLTLLGLLTEITKDCAAPKVTHRKLFSAVCGQSQ